MVRKGDFVTVVLDGAGFSTREEYEVLSVSKGVIFTTDSDYGYDAKTGKWLGENIGGFARRVEIA